jgi:hypothetical protein
MVLAAYSLLLFLFRKKRDLSKENEATTQGVVFSPISGSIKSIEKDIQHDFYGSELNRIIITVHPWNEYGVYLPCSAEIIDLSEKNNTKEYFRYKKISKTEDKFNLGTNFLLKSDNQNNIGMQFIKCPFGMQQKIIVTPGDRGVRQANIGFMGLGGTIIMYLPLNYEILIDKKAKVLAGETLMACRR